MSDDAAAVRFVFDENLAAVGRSLVKLRNDMAVVGDLPIAELLPRGILDPDWIPLVAERGWIMITNDQRLRTRPVEAGLALAHGLKVVHLHGAVGHQPKWNQAVRLLSRWDGVQAQVERRPDGPWFLSVRSQGVRAMSFDPGGAERIR